MTAASYDLSAQPAAVQPNNLLAPARWLTARHLDKALWFTGIVVVIFGVVLTAIGADISFSLWENFVSSGPAWFTLAMGATAVTSFLPVLVAQGQTRGRFVAAAALALAALAVLLSIFVLVGYGAESLLNERLGWSMALVGEHTFDSRSQIFLVFSEYFVRYLLFGLVGILAGYGFYRAGGWWGTLLLLLTAALPLGLGNILLVQEFEIIRQGFASMTFVWVGLTTATVAGLGLTLAFELVLFFVCYALLRTVPIRTKLN